MKRLFHVGSFNWLLWAARLSRAQAVSTAGFAQIGAGCSIADADYGQNNVPVTADTYKMYSFGGGVDIQAAQRINLRAVDFENLQWPGFQPNGLTPRVWSSGAAYGFC